MKSTTNLSVSVIIPTRNRPDRFRMALQSVLAQTLPPLEVIVVDVASTTNYVDEVLAEYTGPVRLKCLKLSEARPAGVVRNFGAEHAVGSILMFLDDDDTWTEDKLERQVRIFEENPDVGLVYSGRQVVDENGNIQYSIIPSLEGDIFEAMLHRNHVGVTSSVAVRTDLFRELGGFDPELSVREDYELWLRICQRSLVKCDRKATVRYTVFSSALKQTSGNASEYEKAVESILQKHAVHFNRLSPIRRRRALAAHYTLVADKYWHIGSPRFYTFIVRSCLQFPTLAALSRLLPYKTWVAIRRAISVLRGQKLSWEGR